MVDIDDQGESNTSFRLGNMSSTVSAQRKGKGIHVTREQKSILKDAFKFIPYPDHYPESLNKLSADTGLDQEAIKKWFRNRRKKVGTKMVDNDDQEEIIEMQTDEASKDADESADESSEEIIQHGALESNEVLAAENVQDMNVSNVDAPIVEEVVTPPPEVEEKSSEVEDKVVEPSQKVKSSGVDPEVVEHSPEEKSFKEDHQVVTPSSSSVVDDTVVLNNTVHESEDDKNVSNVLEKVDFSEPIDNKEPTSPVKNEVNPNATIEIVDNDDEEKPVINGTEDMSTEEKAVQYDVLKNEFSNLQNKFESLAKVLGSHGIDIGSEAPAQPSTSNISTPEGLQPTNPTYHPPEGPVQQQVQYPPEQGHLSTEANLDKREQPYGWLNPGEACAPKQEPQSYGWPNQEYNNPQMYNQWMPYPHYPSQPYSNQFVAPFFPPNYNLPYPPPDYLTPPYANQSPLAPTPVQNAPIAADALYPPAEQSPQTYKTPKARSKAPKKRATPTTQPRVSPYPKEFVPVPNGQSEEAGALPTQAFQGVIGAAKKSFQGPSKSKPKSKPAAPATQTLYPQATVPVQPLSSTGTGGRKKQPPGPIKPSSKPQPQVPEVQTLYPPSALPPQVIPNKIPRRKTLPAKPKLGAHPKPLLKTVPVQYEQSLQASNPFRQIKQKAPTSGRKPTGRAQPILQTGIKSLPGKAQPQIQTLYPPIQNSRPLRQQRPEVEVLRRVTKKTIQKPQDVPRSIPGMSGVSVNRIPGPSFPMMSSSVSIQKVYNPLSDPNKPQELKKVLGMANLSVSLSRK